MSIADLTWRDCEVCIHRRLIDGGCEITPDEILEELFFDDSDGLSCGWFTPEE
jgi:hypothetical protein